jgi:hypothetical protein
MEIMEVYSLQMEIASGSGTVYRDHAVCKEVSGECSSAWSGRTREVTSEGIPICVHKGLTYLILKRNQTNHQNLFHF